VKNGITREQSFTHVIAEIRNKFNGLLPFNYVLCELVYGYYIFSLHFVVNSVLDEVICKCFLSRFGPVSRVQIDFKWLRCCAAVKETKRAKDYSGQKVIQLWKGKSKVRHQ